MQNLPHDTLEVIFDSFPSDVNAKTCLALALTCRQCSKAFASSRKRQCLEKAAMLRWSFVGKDQKRVKLAPPTTRKGPLHGFNYSLSQDKVSWLMAHWDQEFITVKDIWQAQAPALRENLAIPAKLGHTSTLRLRLPESSMNQEAIAFLDAIMTSLEPLAKLSFLGFHWYIERSRNGFGTNGTSVLPQSHHVALNKILKESW